jgi:hypothetical protein
MTNRLVSVAIAVVAMGLYVASLFSEAWSIYGLDSGYQLTGLGCLFAPLQEPIHLLNPAWWANWLFVGGLLALCRNRRGIASACGIAGLLLGVTCWLYCESAVRALICDFGSYSPHVGYWLWLGSMGALTLSSA